MPQAGIRVVRQSGFYRSPPVPASDQPWYVNAVAEVATDLSPEGLLAALHGLEAQFGRARREINEARTVDLDLLDYRGQIRTKEQGAPVLPHPRMAGRGFVLVPLAEISPGWRHPVTGLAVEELIKNMDLNDISNVISCRE